MGARISALASLGPSEIVVWSGAGISWEAPTCIPLGDSLTQMAIDHFTLRGTWTRLIRYFASANLVSASGTPKTVPRLEAVLESLSNVMGTTILTVLQAAWRASPNAYHELLGEHVRLGGSHFTTNFDTCIEHSLGSAPKGTITHVHGTYEPSQLDSLGATIAKVSTGFADPLSTQIVDVLVRAQAIIFVGYSGNDYFDVTPFFRSLNRRVPNLAPLVAVWISHQNHPPAMVTLGTDRPGYTILKGLEACGAQVLYYEGDTHEVLTEQALVWGFSPPVFSAGPCAPPSLTPVTVSPNQRLLLTAQLYTSMGIGCEVVNLARDLEAIAKSSPSAHGSVRHAWFFLNDGCRSVGRYRAALRYGTRLPGTTVGERSARHQRLAVDQWLRGDHFRAWCHFACAGRLLRSQQTAASTDEIKLALVQLDITRLHSLRELTRLPIVGQIIRRYVVIPILERTLGQSSLIASSPHDVGKLIRLYEELGGADFGLQRPDDLEERYPDQRHVFHETDSFMGAVNFLRRDFVVRMDAGVIPSKAELDQLLALATLILDRAGILKAALLLRAKYATNSPGVWRCLLEIEWSLFNKFRWLRLWTTRGIWS